MLAGRRLFLGETDFETVQHGAGGARPADPAHQPAACRRSSSDRRARRSRAIPNQRYQTARDLGRDLNRVLFHFGRAVSSFDIAALVEPVWRDRERTKSRKADKASIIGSLIDEALFEFTSIERESKEDNSIAGSAPLNIGSFENIQDWAGDLGDLANLSEPEPQHDQCLRNASSSAIWRRSRTTRRPRGANGAPPRSRRRSLRLRRRLSRPR